MPWAKARPAWWLEYVSESRPPDIVGHFCAVREHLLARFTCELHSLDHQEHRPWIVANYLLLYRGRGDRFCAESAQHRLSGLLIFSWTGSFHTSRYSRSPCRGIFVDNSVIQRSIMSLQITIIIIKQVNLSFIAVSTMILYNDDN